MMAHVKPIQITMMVGAILLLASGCVRSKPERTLPAVEQAFGASGVQAQVLEPTVTPTTVWPTITPADLLPTAAALPTAAVLPTAEPLPTAAVPTAEPTPAPTLAPPTLAPPTLAPPTPSPANTPTQLPPPPTSAPVPELQTYVVRENDTLYAIAKRHGTSITALQQVNGLGNSDRINFGQTILLPADAVLGSGPEVRTTNYWINHGDTLTSIAQRYRTSMAEILAANPAITDKDAIYVGMRIIVPVNTGVDHIHVVRYGESLTGIAGLYGVTLSSLVQANGLPSANAIYAGQQLIIPD